MWSLVTGRDSIELADMHLTESNETEVSETKWQLRSLLNFFFFGIGEL